MKATSSRWREICGARLVSASQAVSLVRSGDRVWTGGWTSVPLTLCQALAARRGELRDVAIMTFLTPFDWDTPELRATFRVLSFYAGPLERPAVLAGRFDYAPVAQFRDGEPPPGIDPRFDVAMIPISPPDDDGDCSFGGSVWFGPTIAKTAKAMIGEIHPEFIRTGGDNRIHVSRFDRLAEASAPPPPPIPPRSAETTLAAEVVCTLVAAEIIPDRATVQIGVGDVSAALAAFLGDKHDLGIHSEIMPGGLVDLMKQGVVTGRYKTLHPGKVVASALVQMPPEDLAYIDGNPTVELYDFTHTDDLRNLFRLENFFAVNNALAVDVTGNVSSETNGSAVFSGPGGQPSFAISASVTNGGSVIVLPSSQLVNGVRRPRIVAQHPAGTTITVHRGFVDTVVTEQGIARLRGKSIRRRVAEMVAIAHPDLRGELRREAARLHVCD